MLAGGPATYSGGKFRWPVIGGDNYVSQYFHYGHCALDIAADYGAKVVAAAPGKVIFAGWKSNGGGYQVWISHGSGIYTTYNHMSSISVSSGAERGPRHSRSAASAPAATPPARTSTSRSGTAGCGTAARASTRCRTSRRDAPSS